jgi:broad-specificity NMP kinase
MLKKKLKKIFWFFANPRLLLCWGVAWLITNGWSYIMLGLGILFDIAWMQAVAGAYLAFLWMPVTPEKIVTTIIAMFLLKLFFPKDEKTLGILRDLLEKIKAKLHRRGNKKKKEKKKVQSAEIVGAIIDRPDEITLTRAEIDALDKHNARMREETIKEVFSEVKEVLEKAKKLEHTRAEMAQTNNGEQKHQYAEGVCIALIVDIENMERRIIDDHT